MVSKIILVIVAIVSVVNCSAVSKCDVGEVPLSVHIDGCSNDAEYCEVTRNTTKAIALTFTSNTTQHEMEAEVYTRIAGEWKKKQIGASSNVCNNLSEGACPLEANAQATFTYTMVNPANATIGDKISGEVKILDENKNIVACTRITVKVAA